MVIKILFKEGAEDTTRNMVIETKSQELVAKLQECKDYGSVSEVLYGFSGEYAESTLAPEITVDISKSIKKSTDKMLKAFGSKNKRSGY